MAWLRITTIWSHSEIGFAKEVATLVKDGWSLFSSGQHWHPEENGGRVRQESFRGSGAPRGCGSRRSRCRIRCGVRHQAPARG